MSTTQTPSVSDTQFAQEVRTDRLSLLWQVTLVAAILLIWVALTISATHHLVSFTWLAVCLIVVVGSALTGRLLRRNFYRAAVWCYAGSIAAAISLMLYSPPGLVREAMPFAFPLLVFIVGLLLPPTALIWLCLLIGLIIIGVPALHDQAISIGPHQALALLFTGIAALLTAQAAGELYAIAEWALSHYRRERERKLELHQSQIDLKKALARAQVLAENLEQANASLASTNVELERARATAEEAKNFRGKFLANMSHELRTPLNAIIGFSETMLHFPEMYDNVPLPLEYQRDMEQVHISGQQLLYVINDILDLSRVDAGKLDLQPCVMDLEPIFKATLTTATGLIGDRPIRLLRNLPKTLPLVYADPNRVRQILLNLYSNAVKFTEQGSITLSLTCANGDVVIGVTDTGCGIPPEEHEIIFEEFRQGRAGLCKPSTGSGLGLAIARHLVTLMNGRIWVESEVGVGSAFYFTLPRAPVEEIPAPDQHTPVLERT